MASYNRLIDNYEKRIKELNSNLVAFNLQAGHLLLSGKTDFNDEEYRRPYELIASDISSINDKCRAISANEQRRSELEKDAVELRKKIQNYTPEKKKKFHELGLYLFDNYTQHFASSFGPVFQMVSEEKKASRIIEEKLSDVEEQIENKDFFSKLVYYVRQSSLKAQLASHARKIEDLLADGGEKAFKSGVVTVQNGGTAYSACRILQDEIDSLSSKHEDMVTEIGKITEKLKESEKKSVLLSAAADKAGELDKLAESAGDKFIGKYVSLDGNVTEAFPESYSRILEDVVETRKELCSLARRKELLRCTEQIENAVASIESLKREKEHAIADIERLNKRIDELSERIESTAAAAEVIKQKKIALEVEEGISVSRLLGVKEEAPQQPEPETAGNVDGQSEPAEAETAEKEPAEAESDKSSEDAEASASDKAETPEKNNTAKKSPSAGKKSEGVKKTNTKKSSSKSGKTKADTKTPPEEKAAD